MVRNSTAAGGGKRENDEAPRSKAAEREREKRLSGTARGSMTVNHDVVSSSLTGAAMIIA